MRECAIKYTGHGRSIALYHYKTYRSSVKLVTSVGKLPTKELFVSVNCCRLASAVSPGGRVPLMTLFPRSRLLDCDAPAQEGYVFVSNTERVHSQHETEGITSTRTSQWKRLRESGEDGDV